MKNIIKFINHSIAYKCKNVIYINKNLKLYPDLYKRILKHEKQHTNNETYTKKDFIIDSTTNIHTLELLEFCIKHPQAFWQFSPIYYKDGIWLYSWSMLIKWIILISVIMGVILGVNWFNKVYIV